MSEALRYDEDKINLLNIHPYVFHACIIDSGNALPCNYLDMVNYMQSWFFYNKKDYKSYFLYNMIKLACPVLDFGTIKYDKFNYVKGMEYSRVMKSFLRHTMALAGGETNDVESKLPHLSHMAANVLFAITYQELGYDDEGLDDREPYYLGDSDNYLHKFCAEKLKELKESRKRNSET